MKRSGKWGDGLAVLWSKCSASACFVGTFFFFGELACWNLGGGLVAQQRRGQWRSSHQ